MHGARVATWAESVVFAALGGFLLYASFGSFSNLWASYRDSPAVTYIFSGGPAAPHRGLRSAHARSRARAGSPRALGGGRRGSAGGPRRLGPPPATTARRAAHATRAPAAGASRGSRRAARGPCRSSRPRRRG